LNHYRTKPVKWRVKGALIDGMAVPQKGNNWHVRVNIVSQGDSQMPTWTFKTVTDETGAASAGKWYWRMDTGQRVPVTSAQLFGSLVECAADAHNSGFRGTVVPSGGRSTDVTVRDLERRANRFLGTDAKLTALEA
jgi:hypothetical protein